MAERLWSQDGLVSQMHLLSRHQKYLYILQLFLISCAVIASGKIQIYINFKNSLNLAVAFFAACRLFII